MYKPAAQVSALLAVWRMDIDSEPFTHDAALSRAPRRWNAVHRWRVRIGRTSRRRMELDIDLKTSDV